MVCGGVDGGQGLFGCSLQLCREVGGGRACDFFPLQRTGIFASNNKARIDSLGSPSQYASFREFTLLVFFR
uniref:Uncharacterized protein n=1 Tax=Triticum urartu TaxID=4572 RepID=A0A8R7K0T3_TRIUA